MGAQLRHLFCALGVAALSTTAASAQYMPPPGGALVVSTCGTLNWPVLNNGKPNYQSLTVLPNGNLCTNATGGGGGGGSVTQGTSPWVDNITQWGGTAVGAPTAYGTAPTGNAPGVNAFVTNFPATQAVTWTNQTVAATQSGTWSVGVNNFPTTQTVAGTVTANQGGAPWSTTISGTLPAFAATPTFNLGMLNGAATAANQTAATGSAAGGTAASVSTLGGLIYNSTPPTLTNGQQVGQQADINGNTKVNVANPYQTTTGNALEPPTAASGKMTVTSTALAVNTNTTIAAANTSRIAFGIQCAGTAVVNVSENGATLASAVFGAAGATVQMPVAATPYFSPPVASRTAITAYTGTAQTCVVTEYNR